MTDEIIDAEVVEDDDAPLPAVSHSEVSGLMPYTMPSFDTPADYLQWRSDQLLEALDRILVEDVHYGKLPGTDKMTLFKPGAEWLLKMFDLSFRPEILPLSIVDIPNRFVSVVIRGEVYDASGRMRDSAVASCSSEESRWQRSHCPQCGESVWDNRKNKRFDNQADYACRDKAGCGWSGDSVSKGFSPDLVNTIIKMAEKRAKVAAALTATGASSYFTQDTDDKARTKPTPGAAKSAPPSETRPTPMETVTGFPPLMIGGADRMPDGSLSQACPYCMADVEHHEPEGKADRKPRWKCTNRDCQGGAERKGGGHWPWASWHDEPWKEGGEIDQLLDDEETSGPIVREDLPAADFECCALARKGKHTASCPAREF